MEQDHSKKEQIISLYSSDHLGVEEIEKRVGASASYVAKVLTDAGYLQNYFDLYTSTKHSMNIYSKLFVNRLGFKTKKVAERSVNFINRWYQTFKKNHDHTGQHHALVIAMTMFNRARWMKKKEEALVFQQWIIRCLQDEMSDEGLVHH